MRFVPIGPFELLIILAIGGVLLIVPIALVVVLIRLLGNNKNRDSRDRD